MLDYARSDTHYLLFIYDNLRNALLDRSLSRSQSRIQSPAGQDVMQDDGASPRPPDFLLREVLSRSEETALRIYEKEVYDAETGSGPGGWDTLAKKWNKGPMLSGQDGTPRMEIYKRMHAWRDRVAREEDESTRYVIMTRRCFSLLTSLLDTCYPITTCSCLRSVRQMTWLHYSPCSHLYLSSFEEGPRSSWMRSGHRLKC